MDILFFVLIAIVFYLYGLVAFNNQKRQFPYANRITFDLGFISTNPNNSI